MKTQLTKREKFFVEMMVGCSRNSGELEDLHSRGKISQDEMGRIKDGIRKQISYHIKSCKEYGLKINWSKDSIMEKSYLKLLK